MGLPGIAGVLRRHQVQHSPKATGLRLGMRVPRHEAPPLEEDRVSAGDCACGGVEFAAVWMAGL